MNFVDWGRSTRPVGCSVGEAPDPRGHAGGHFHPPLQNGYQLLSTHTESELVQGRGDSTGVRGSVSSVWGKELGEERDCSFRWGRGDGWRETFQGAG